LTDPGQRVSAAALTAFQAQDQAALHHVLRLRPWEVSPLEATTEEAPPWAGPRDAWRVNWPLARELRAALTDRDSP
jgi:hypothetical protein